MSAEDHIRMLLQHADDAMPSHPDVSWAETMRRAQRQRIAGMMMMGFATTVVIAFAVVAVSSLSRRGGEPSPPAGSPSPTVVAERCSATGLSPTPAPEKALEPPVASTGREIAAAATACDYAGLERLAQMGGRRFTYSFGAAGAQGFARYLREQDKETRILSVLVETLTLSSCIERSGNTSIVQWPAAFCDGASDEDWAQLRGLYPPQEIASWRETGFFGGYRVGITESGTWLFFVAGD